MVVVHDRCAHSEVSINTVVINKNNIVDCSQITVTNNTHDTIRWELVSLTGESLYTTPICHSGSVYTIHLSSNIKPNTQFKLRAQVPGQYTTSCVILKFIIKSSQATNFILKGTCFKTNLYYAGTSNI